MKIKIGFLLILSALLLVGCQDSQLSQLELNQESTEKVELRALMNGVERYNFPEGNSSAPKSRYFSAQLNGVDYYVYPVPLMELRKEGVCNLDRYLSEMMSFGISENASATIKIRSTYPIRSYAIRPKRQKSQGGFSNYSVTKVDANTLLLKITGPQNLSVEINDNLLNPFLIFANPISNSPHPNSCRYYFDEGKVHHMGEMMLKSNDLVYIAPGAIVKGNFVTEIGATNVRITGRGILAGVDIPAGGKDEVRRHAISYRIANGSSIEGIIIVNSQNWVVPLYDCDNIVIDGVKIVSVTGYEDGIDVVGCRNVLIKNCFIWTKDDCIAIKAGIKYNRQDHLKIDGRKNIYDIRVQNCVLWNGVNGNALEIGCELNGDIVENITYNNIDIIHAQCPCGADEGVLSINNHGNGVVRRVTYSNIYVEDIERYFLNIKVVKSPYSPGEEHGYKDVTYKGGYAFDVQYRNIHLTKKNIHIHSAFMSDPGPHIGDVKINDLFINGNRITSYSLMDDNNLSNSYNKFILCEKGMYGFLLNR